MTAENQAPEGAPDLRAAAQTALDALENNTGEYRVTGAASTLRAALAAQPQQARAYREANPLGGPAKVFRAMADAIEAGDSYEDTLRRFEYAEARPSPAEGDVLVQALKDCIADIELWMLTHHRQADSVACVERAKAALSAQPQPKGTCRYCDGTGDVHSLDGEWRGVCTECPAGEAPDGAHEALQRLIENAASLGPASRDDARLVAKWRRPLLSPRVAPAHAPAPEPAPPEPLTEAEAIKLWHATTDAHRRSSAFEWFSAGLIAAQSRYGILKGQE